MYIASKTAKKLRKTNRIPKAGEKVYLLQYDHFMNVKTIYLRVFSRVYREIISIFFRYFRYFWYSKNRISIFLKFRYLSTIVYIDPQQPRFNININFEFVIIIINL